MKKLIFIICVFASTNTLAAELVDHIGYECARILKNLEDYDYPTNYNNIKPRNSQFWALEKCLKVYEYSGGNIQELNKRFEVASALSSFEKLQAIAAGDKQKFLEVMSDITFRNIMLNERDRIEYFNLSSYNEETKKTESVLVKDAFPEDAIAKFKEPVKIQQPEKSWFRRIFK